MSSPQWKNFPSTLNDAPVIPLQHSSSNFSSTSNASQNSTPAGREFGIIEKLLHSYGFIECCERQARLFFHYSQFSGNIEHLKIGDPVEFEMTYDRKTGKPIASLVMKISPEVMCEVLSEDRVTGCVTTEIKSSTGNGSSSQGRISYENRGECFFLPYTADDVERSSVIKAGDKVTFQIATDKRSGNLHARNIKLDKASQQQRFQGVVCSLKESFGFIERGDVVKEIFFHFSEAKSVKDLKLGDHVEFSIQSRNGKEVAVNVSSLPDGTVVFDDINEEKVIGQIIKLVDKGQTRHQSDPLPGRVRYRRDGRDIEIQFGEKDQLKDYTLMSRDWVLFNIATDRRDQLQRATNIDLLEESFLTSGEKREKGVITAVKDGFGFIKCQEREARMFFHFSELLDVEHDVKIHEEVEFTVVQDPSTPSRHNAVRIRFLLPGTVKFDGTFRDMLTGVVVKEPSCISNGSVNGNENGRDLDQSEFGTISYQVCGVNESIQFYTKDCDHRALPKVGDKVTFLISQAQDEGAKIAVDVRVLGKGLKNGLKYTHQGFIAALKDGFGFIETSEHDREIFFHYSVFDGDTSQLELGMEVEYNLAQKNSKLSAECVRKLPKGTIPTEDIEEQILEGEVMRPVRFCNPDQEDYPGLIEVKVEETGDVQTYLFGITSLSDKRDFLQKGDTVQFQIGIVKDTGHRRAMNVKAQRKKLQSTVEAIKGQFGFLSHEEEEGKKLFFHMSEVKDAVQLHQGDRVEFVIMHNQRTGRFSACNVVKLSSAAEMPRPERLISRLRTTSGDGGPRLTVIRQPRGPDGTNGFKQSREVDVEKEETLEVA